MRKSMYVIFGLLAVFAVIMTGCGGGSSEPGNNPTTSAYTVQFESNGGSKVDPITIPTSDAGKPIAKPADPTKVDFEFDGWYKNKELTTAWNFDTDTITGNTTIYAKWTETEEDNDPDHRKYFDVTLMDGETEINKFRVSFGSLISTPAAPPKTGFDFGGWYKAYTDGEWSNKWKFDDDRVTADTTLYAKYTEIVDPGPGPFTVRFAFTNAAGKLELVRAATISNVAKGSKITAPTADKNPEKEDYTFAAWCKDEDLTIDWNFAVDTVTGPTILYARFTPIIDDPPEDIARAEKLTLANAWYAVYYFELPAGKTTDNYSELKAQYTLTRIALKNGVARGARLMGPYPKEFFTFVMGSASGSAPGKGVAVANYSRNGNAEYILDNTRGSGDWGGSDVGSLVTALENAIGYAPNPGEWFELRYVIDGSKKHADYGKNDVPQADPAGPLLYGLGLPGQGPSDDQGARANTFYVRDITLVGKPGTDDVIGRPLYFIKDGYKYPVYTGYNNPNGTAGHKEASRESCDNLNPPKEITVDWEPRS